MWPLPAEGARIGRKARIYLEAVLPAIARFSEFDGRWRASGRAGLTCGWQVGDRMHAAWERRPSGYAWRGSVDHAPAVLIRFSRPEDVVRFFESRPARAWPVRGWWRLGFLAEIISVLKA